MGRIKSTLVKRTTKNLLTEQDFPFTGSFEDNKKILGMTMPSKRIRNMIAGYLGRLKKMQSKESIKQAQIS